MNGRGELSRLCKRYGALWGAASPEPFESVRDAVAAAELDGFCEKDINKRIDPAATMENVKSIICLLFPYKRPENGNTHRPAPKNPAGIIESGDVWLGEDYHVYVMRKLRELCEELRTAYGGEYMPFCDTGPLVDKEVAVRAGLCAYGRSGLAINAEYGTFFYIGYILTDLEIEKAAACKPGLSEYCVTCDRCVKACPTGALKTDMPFEHKKCVSYISQKKGELTAEESRSLGNRVYGCHICQNACPLNEKAEFYRLVELPVEMSNRDFYRLLGDTAARFIGKKRFLRNSRAVRENMKK